MVKKSTYEYYNRICRYVFKNYWDQYNTQTIHPNIITELTNNLIDKYSAKSLKDITAIGNQILEFAYEKGLTKIYACKKVKLSYRKNHPTVLTAKEQKKLSAFLQNDTDPSKLGVLISLFTGLRLGEICGLQWGDVNLTRGTIHVSRTVQRIGSEWLIDTPKTECSDRILPVPSFLIKILKNFRASEAYYVASGTEDFVQPRTYQNRLKQYLKQCALPEYHFHALRHTFASRAIELGFDPKSLSEILGHANVKITLDLYVHPSLDAKTKQMNLFAKVL